MVLSMQHFADIALAPVMDDEIEFYPKKYKNTYRHWLENIKDWCISRQLWWATASRYSTTARRAKQQPRDRRWARSSSMRT